MSRHIELAENVLPTAFFEKALLPNGWVDHVRVAMADDRISSVETAARPSSTDIRSGYAIPGLANLHSHGFQRGMAGLAERRRSAGDSFWSWREVMYAFLDRMTPDDLESVTALAFSEMLEGGFTRVGEFHYVHHDTSGQPFSDLGEMATRVASAAATSGIRLTLLPCFYESSGFGGQAADRGQRRFITTVDMYADLVAASRKAVGDLAGADVGVAPHSLRAVTPSALASVVEIGGGRSIHIHVSEQSREVQDCVAWCGQRPVEWLLDHAEIGAQWTMIHATHTTAHERLRLARQGATVCVCPTTEASLGDGVFTAEEWVALGGTLGIGTDANVATGVAEELRQLEYGQRLASRRRNVMAGSIGSSTAMSLYDAALRAGATSLGIEALVITPGARADIVTLASEARCFAAEDQASLLDCWVFGSDRKVVDDVWVAGRRVVVGGHHVRGAAIEKAYRDAVRRLVADS